MVKYWTACYLNNSFERMILLMVFFSSNIPRCNDAW